MTGKSNKNFDSTLASILQQVNGDTTEFLDVVFDYLDRKTNFAQEEAKQKVTNTLERHISPPNSSVSMNSSECAPENNVAAKQSMATKKSDERWQKFLRKW
jgi:hypothetical protein